jgi:ABC-type Mn2+/Zn2+ transport system ATPase subunit
VNIIQGTDLTVTTPEGGVLFKDLSFTVSVGDLLLVTGPNGSGKSSLLRALMGEFSPHKGRVHINVDKKDIAVIPQLQNMEFHLPVTLQDVIELSQERVVEAETIESVGLLARGILFRPWNSASGGERQRTLLTCALLKAPRVLVLDEPFNHLDLVSQKTMLEKIKSFLKEDGTSRAVILVSHLQLQELSDLGNHLISLQLGSGNL